MDLKLNRNLFLRPIPEMYPNTPDYNSFWREDIKRHIEGYWVSGVWMPGGLHYYVNRHTIRLNRKGTKNKVYGFPFLRDIEWEIFYTIEETKGFSGFTDDPFISCNRALEDPDEYTDKELVNLATDMQTGEIIQKIYDNFFGNNGRKEYVPARDYLRRVHSGNLGSPLYLNDNKNMIMMGARGFGKPLDDNTPIPTPLGWKKIKDLKVGDEVLGIKGDTTKVTAKYPQGIQPVYKFTFSDGQSIVSDASHKWRLHKNYCRAKDYTTEEIVRSAWRRPHKKGGFNFSYTLPKVSPILYSEKSLPIPPYILGVLLGDGNFTGSNTRIASNDEEIIDAFRKQLPWASLVSDPTTNNFRITVGKRKLIPKKYKNFKNPLRGALHSLELLGKSAHTKFIPTIYLRSSYKQRLKLLQGLMDSDGSIFGAGSMEFSSANKELAYGVAELVRSLGGRCKVGMHDRRGRVHKMPTGDWSTTKNIEWRAYIQINECPFYLARKALKFRKKKIANTALIGIERVEDRNTTCITVDDESSLFLAAGYIPTHNSYIMSGLIAHEFLFDGNTSYPMNPKLISETMIGAGDTTYSGETLSKVKEAFDNMPGGIEMDGITKFIKPPLYKHYTGSFRSGSDIIAGTKKKTTRKVTASSIKHRAFRDNEFAGVGTRPSKLLFEEIGVMNNLIPSFNAMVEAQRTGKKQFGSTYMVGTGGNMAGKGTRDAHRIFYDPESFNMVTFRDDWEHRGNIGLFIEAALGLGDFKNNNGMTDLKAANKFLDNARKELVARKSYSRLESEIVMRPQKPSEIFLMQHGNILPVKEAQDRLTEITGNRYLESIQKVVTLKYSEKGNNGVSYEIDTTGRLKPINEFPVKDLSNREGAVVIYEFPQVGPDGKVPEGLYIIGHDPYKSDSSTGGSLATIFVLKTAKYPTKYGFYELVAEYRGRPYHGRKIVNDILLKLSLFYGNATVFFENEVGNVKEYFERRRKLYLLCKQPQTILTNKASGSTSGSIIYGYPMNSRKMKQEGLNYLRDWCLESRGKFEEKDVTNISKLPSPALLQEIVLFNFSGNFDNVMGFLGCMLGLEEHYNLYDKEFTQERTTLDETLEYFSKLKI